MTCLNSTLVTSIDGELTGVSINKSKVHINFKTKTWTFFQLYVQTQSGQDCVGQLFWGNMQGVLSLVLVIIPDSPLGASPPPHSPCILWVDM